LRRLQPRGNMIQEPNAMNESQRKSERLEPNSEAGAKVYDQQLRYQKRKEARKRRRETERKAGW